MISKDDYCIKVCKARCCKHKATGHTCAHLSADCKCKIYKERFAEGSADSEVVDVFVHSGRLLQLICERIEKLIATNSLDPEVRAQCCYADPSLLEGQYGTETDREKLA